MRTVTTPHQNAITDNELIMQTARLTLYKSRVYFEQADLTDRSPTFAHPIGETGLYIPEALSSTANGFMTVSVNSVGDIYLMLNGSSTAVRPTVSGTPLWCDYRCRPGLYGNTLFYYDATSHWKKTTIDTALLAAGTAACRR